MKITVKDLAAAPGKSDLLVVFALEGTKTRLPSGVELPPRTLRSVRTDFREIVASDAVSGPVSRAMVIGLGNARQVDAERLRRAAALAAKRAEAEGATSLTVWAEREACDAAGGPEAAGQALAEGVVMGTYRDQRFKSKQKPAKLARVVLCGPGAPFRRGAERGRVAGEANCFARDLQNAPGNRMRPRDLAAAARKLAARSARITCRVLEPAGMQKLGMGALLGVAAGTAEPPRLIHLVHRPKGRVRGKVALVGKGLTFDAGGISLKPAARMADMKYDMSGGAAVLGVFHALAALDLPLEVHGIVPSSENLPDAKAVKPGDILTAMDGTTIEVLNTDAEGRLILCDALAYTIEKVKPDAIVDLATLTGAVVVALGHELSGMFASTPTLRDELTQAGEEVAELVWPLPLFDFHRDQMKSEVADLRNINSPDHGNGSTSGAAFLAHFVGDVEWAHLDIAGTAWGGRDRDWVGGSQGSGVGVRLLLRWLELRAGASR